MNRIEQFENLKNHPWLGRICKKLKQEDFLVCENFLQKNAGLNKQDFEMAVNRMFLDKAKPKKWAEIMELLVAANNI